MLFKFCPKTFSPANKKIDEVIFAFIICKFFVNVIVLLDFTFKTSGIFTTPELLENEPVVDEKETIDKAKMKTERNFIFYVLSE